MTLPQLAAFLDQLKRPIEEAPMYPSSPPVLAEKCNGDWWLVDNIRETETYGWVGDEYLTRDDEVDHLAYFLPLPAPGPVEFEVVPVGTVKDAYVDGLTTFDCLMEDHLIDSYWSESDTQEKLRGFK